MKATWKRPAPTDLTPYQRGYIDEVPSDDLPDLLARTRDHNIAFFQNIAPEKLKYRYAEGKWSIPQILVHMIDTERIFTYRILCIARGDKTPLPGFEENDYARASKADERNFTDIIEEYITVRNATLTLMKSLDQEMIEQKGTANNMAVTPAHFAWMLAGHELHHTKVIRERYLSL